MLNYKAYLYVDMSPPPPKKKKPLNKNIYNGFKYMYADRFNSDLFVSRQNILT